MHSDGDEEMQLEPLVSGGVREPTLLDGISTDKYEFTYLLRATDTHLRKTLSPQEILKRQTTFHSKSNS